MQKQRALEIRVGIFVLTAFGLLTVFLLNMDVFKSTDDYRLHVLFNDANGLEVGSTVQLAGVQVGHVEGIHIRKGSEGNTFVSVVSSIDKGVAIDVDAEASIIPGGLLGQKYLQILPGSPGARSARDGEVLHGLDPITIDGVARVGQRIVNKLESSVDYLNTFIGDEAFQAQTKENVAELGQMLSSLKETTQSLKIVLARLENGEGTIGKLLTDEEIYDDMRALVKDVRNHPWKLLKRERSTDSRKSGRK